MNKGRLHKIGLFALIFVIPLLFLFIISKGNTEYKKLLYYADQATEQPIAQVPDFLFYDKDSNVVSKESLAGKAIVFNVLIPSCPTYCPVLGHQLKNLVYKDILEEERLKDFVIVSLVLDTNKDNKINLDQVISENEVDHSRWKFVTGEGKPNLYNFSLMDSINVSKNAVMIGGELFYQTILLIDKEHYLRGFYLGSNYLEMDRLNQELMILNLEYASDKESN